MEDVHHAEDHQIGGVNVAGAPGYHSSEEDAEAQAAQAAAANDDHDNVYDPSHHHGYEGTTGEGHSSSPDKRNPNNMDYSMVDSASSPPPATPSTNKKRKLAPRRSWETRIQQLLEYKEQHGHLEIPVRYKENPSLGKFVHNTREQYKTFLRLQEGQQNGSAKPKKCPLTAERVAQLEHLGFVFATDRAEKQNQEWEARLQQLKDYKEEHGDCFVRKYHTYIYLHTVASTRLST
jgi:hypothetical protein